MTDDRIPKPCPVCKTDSALERRGQFVECRNPRCRLSGPKGESPEHAVWLWNRINFDDPRPALDYTP